MTSALQIIAGDLHCSMQACIFGHDLILELHHPLVF